MVYLEQRKKTYQHVPLELQVGVLECLVLDGVEHVGVDVLRGDEQHEQDAVAVGHVVDRLVPPLALLLRGHELGAAGGGRGGLGVLGFGIIGFAVLGGCGLRRLRLRGKANREAGWYKAEGTLLGEWWEGVLSMERVAGPLSVVPLTLAGSRMYMNQRKALMTKLMKKM